MHKADLLKERMKKAALMVPLFLFLLLVGVWLSDHGMGIPCVFYSLTGLQCPGCGVTRMFSALFKGDFAAAYHSNAAIFLLLPILAGIGCYASVHWLKTGSWAFPRWMDWLIAACAVFLIGFAVMRNLNVLI